MAKVVSPKIKFHHSGVDVASIRVRLSVAESVPDYNTAYDEVPLPPQDADGFRRIALSSLPKVVGKEGTFDVDLTAVDVAGNESDFLQINSANFDLSPPEAPTDGALD
jgi:hypothetical protein